MLAYLFWHRPTAAAAREPYEHALLAFHRSLARRPPVGMRGSAAFRSERPWAAGTAAAGEEQGWYEDWYLVADFTALGVLNEAAVGVGHRSRHEQVARATGAGAGGVYLLVEGELGASAGSLGAATQATWVARPPGARVPELGELLGDGMDPGQASLWRRQLVLGPAPEHCLLAREPTPGVAPNRLPAGWSALTLRREAIFAA